MSIGSHCREPLSKWSQCEVYGHNYCLYEKHVIRLSGSYVTTSLVNGERAHLNNVIISSHLSKVELNLMLKWRTLRTNVQRHDFTRRKNVWFEVSIIHIIVIHVFSITMLKIVKLKYLYFTKSSWLVKFTELYY